MKKETLVIIGLSALCTILLITSLKHPNQNSIGALVDERLSIHAQIIELQNQEAKLQSNICSKEASLCAGVSTGAIVESGVTVSTAIEELNKGLGLK